MRGLAGSLVGSLVIVMLLVVYHLWSDHQAFHVMLNYLNDHAAKINRLP